jgi:osmotically-inducible protein OsmY
MRKVEVIAVVILAAAVSAVAAAAQSTQPPAASQQGGEMQSQALTPQEQAKLVNGVRHALIMLPYYGVFDSLAFRLQGRTVILEGQVLTSSLKPDAAAAVKKVEGVDQVVNNIKVLNAGALDDRIRHEVYRAIYNYGPLFKYANMPNPPIRIIVQNARVTLEGVVDNETDKGLCTMRVNQVPDVLSVTNNLAVAKPSGKPS